VELKDFVKRALVEVIEAVREAAEETRQVEDGARVSPRLYSGSGQPVFGVDRVDGGGIAFPVDFDLAITVEEREENAAGVGGKVGAAAETRLNIVSVFRLGASASGEAQGETRKTAADAMTTVQRIRFSVPVRFPQTTAPERNVAGPVTTGLGPDAWMR